MRREYDAVMREPVDNVFIEGVRAIYGRDPFSEVGQLLVKREATKNHPKLRFEMIVEPYFDHDLAVVVVDYWDWRNENPQFRELLRKGRFWYDWDRPAVIIIYSE